MMSTDEGSGEKEEYAGKEEGLKTEDKNAGKRGKGSSGG